METYDVLVIGGGQAGLAAGYHLQRAGLRFLILEGSAEATGSWKHYYDSLKLFSPARYSSLPGMRFPGKRDRYPTRDEVINYLRDYAKQFDLPVRTNAFVEHVERQGMLFVVRLKENYCLRAKHIIAATGAFTRPYIPELEGQERYSGTTLHSSAYVNSTPFENQRVLVIGAGNSAVQIAVDLAQSAQVTLTSRDPVRFKRQRLLGLDVHFWARVTGADTWSRPFSRWSPAEIKKPFVLDSGNYQAALGSGNPNYRAFFTHFTEQGVVWANGEESSFDAVVFATGFRPNLGYLDGLAALDEYGNAIHEGGISATTPGLYYVGISGQRSFASATLRGVGDDAAYIVRDLRRSLKHPANHQEKRCCLIPRTT